MPLSRVLKVFLAVTPMTNERLRGNGNGSRCERSGSGVTCGPLSFERTDQPISLQPVIYSRCGVSEC